MIVGAAGHIDHGKSALVRALTGVDTDRLKEEKARGISIDLGFAYLPRPDGSTIGFVDVPGHERFVRNMLAGASGVDLVLLAVAADDGPMPQTREHLAIVDLLGVRRGVVALTKCDLVDADRRIAAEAEVRATLSGTGLEDVEILPVSSMTGEGLEDLLALLDAEAERGAARKADGRFRLAVDRCFTLAGAGTVVTGAVRDGVVRVGDAVVISPSGISARVRAIHAQNRPAEEGRPGERCALNLAGPDVTKDAIGRGDVVGAPELHAPTDRIDVELRLLASEPKALTAWTPVRLHHGSADVAARLVPLEGESVAPGETARAQLALEKPIAAIALDRFVLRDTSASRTIAGGKILDLRGPARRRRSPERRDQLDALSRPSHAEALKGLLEASPHAVEFDAFLRDRNIAANGGEALAAELGLVRLRGARGAVVLATSVWTAFARDVAEKLAAHHADHPDLQGIGAERLRLSVEPRLAAPTFIACLAALQRQGAVAVEGAWIRLPGHVARLAPADEALWEDLATRLDGEQRFRPPRVRDLSAALGDGEVDIRRTLKLAGRLGWVDEIAHDHFFLRETTAEMVEIAVDVAQTQGVLTAAPFRDRLDNGRKVAIQILEFFDRHGVTIRRGDERRINQRRRDLFNRADVTAAVESASDPTGRVPS